MVKGFEINHNYNKSFKNIITILREKIFKGFKTNLCNWIATLGADGVEEVESAGFTGGINCSQCPSRLEGCGWS